jgi:hypothetical protein
VETFWQDVSQGLRMVARNPRFTAYRATMHVTPRPPSPPRRCRPERRSCLAEPNAKASRQAPPVAFPVSGLSAIIPLMSLEFDALRRSLESQMRMSHI